MAARRDRINAAFAEAARTLGVSSQAQTKGSRPGPVSRDPTPEHLERNPSLGGTIRDHRLEISNHTEASERVTRCVVELAIPVFPSGVSMRAKLAGPFTDSWNPVVRLLERVAAANGGRGVFRPQPRSSSRLPFYNKWVQLDDVDDDGYMVAGKFDWPNEAGPPPYGTPDAVMTPARTRALRELFEAGGQLWLLELDSSSIRYSIGELHGSDDLVSLANAALGLADTLTD